jgi:N-acetylneuraminate synthase
MILAVIPAKGESGRLPDKNLQVVEGKTLIEHAVAYARASDRIDAVAVSTDSDAIAAHARGLGVEVIRRGKDLGGETPLIDVYRHAFQTVGDGGVTHVVGVQPDNPDRQVDVAEVLDHVIEKKIDDLFTVDRHGRRNGALVVLSRRALEASPFPYASTWMDDCTNIHTPLDLEMARRRLSPHAGAILVEGRAIGEDHPAWVIAEAACNHMCDLGVAREMIDRAAEAGADAVKFQTYKAEKLVTGSAVSFWGGQQVSQLDYYRRLDRFDRAAYEALFAHGRERGITVFSSPFDEESTDMLADLGMPIFKIASCDIPNLEHLRHIARIGRPVVLSTGASTEEEIDRALEVLFQEGNHQVMLLACTLSYPTSPANANLKRIQTLKERYPGMIVGLSDHTEPDPQMVIPAIAVAMGARIIEKHYTLDRSWTGSGHYFAVDPPDLRRMVENIRMAETVRGDGSLGVAESEAQAWSSARRSIVAEAPVRRGQVLERGMLGLKRPGGGLGADMLDRVVGRRVTRDLEADERIRLEDLEAAS